MNLTHTYTGGAPYYADHPAGPHRLVVAIGCQIGDFELHALLDTGADWCVLPPGIAELLGYSADPDPDVPPYHTRHGIVFGRQERIPVTFVAREGTPFVVEATWFISPDWPGPAVLGWKGCLERLRFALDPTPGEEWFYFGPIGDSQAP